jgi:hypothetical protein
MYALHMSEGSVDFNITHNAALNAAQISTTRRRWDIDITP